jgi:hypothetical protein
MKSPLILIALAASSFAAPTMTDRVTAEELEARRKGANPLATLPQPAAGDTAKVARPEGESLIRQSDILSDGTHWTLVPKGAVLHTPPAFAARVGAKPLGTLLSWTDFLTVNRNWLFIEEVSFAQAAGKDPLAPGRADSWAKLGKVVVAVHLGGPISVRTPEPAAPAPAPTVSAK